MLISEAIAFNLHVELMSLCHVCGGSLMAGFLKSRLTRPFLRGGTTCFVEV